MAEMSHTENQCVAQPGPAYSQYFKPHIKDLLDTIVEHDSATLKRPCKVRAVLKDLLRVFAQKPSDKAVYRRMRINKPLPQCHLKFLSLLGVEQDKETNILNEKQHPPEYIADEAVQYIDQLLIELSDKVCKCARCINGDLEVNAEKKDAENMAAEQMDAEKMRQFTNVLTAMTENVSCNSCSAKNDLMETLAFLQQVVIQLIQSETRSRLVGYFYEPLDLKNLDSKYLRPDGILEFLMLLGYTHSRNRTSCLQCTAADRLTRETLESVQTLLQETREKAKMIIPRESIYKLKSAVE